MRRIDHPGPMNEPNVQFMETRVCTVQVRMEAGQSLRDGFAKLLQHYGCQSAVATLGETELMPAVYVMPALSSSPMHAVYYSEKHFPKGVIKLKQGVITVGIRDGDTWIHCHASWEASDGRQHCGHLLPDETVLARAVSVELSLLMDAGFEVCPDEQTNFSLFKPRVLPAQAHMIDHLSAQQAWCLRVAPNIDLCEALESFAAQHAHTSLRVLGGVGSTVGAVFDDGRVVDPFVTELLVTAGQVQAENEQWCAQLDIALVDYTGGVHEGRLQRGQNPVLVTCELVLVPHECGSIC